jgi:hypothetical protein
MKTDDLINAIAADAETARAPIARIVWIGMGVGVVVTALLYLSLLPVRPDLMSAMGDWHFLLKWAFSVTLLGTALALMLRLARPESVPGLGWLLLFGAPLVLTLGVVTEMFAIPSSTWFPTMVGTNAWGCIIFVPILSALPLIVMLLVLRRGATTRPALAGAVAGLVAAGIAATFYATHCQNDSPLFLAAWYVLATLFVAAVGAVLGTRLLRW